MLDDDGFRVVGHITLELPSNFRVPPVVHVTNAPLVAGVAVSNR